MEFAVSEAHLASSEKNQHPHDAALFFRRWLSNPLQMGSIITSSPKLGALIAKQIDKQSSSSILEVGAGTGAITKSLINSGIAPRRIAVVEIVPEMAEHLRTKFPETSVLQTDAFELPTRLLKDNLDTYYTHHLCKPMQLQMRSQHLIYQTQRGQ